MAVGTGSIGFRPMSIKPSWRLAAPVLAAALLLAGCGSSDELGGEVVKDGIGCQPTEVEPGGDAPTLEPIAEVPAEVDTEDLEEGTGCGIETDVYASLDLIGATADDATVFTDTFTDGRPVTASLGTGQLLPGLETGLEGLKVGGRRQVVLPADAAYGPDGNPAQGIGPDEALVFVVHLVAVSDTPIYCTAAADLPAGPEGSGKPATVEMPVEAPRGEVVTTELEPGDGEAIGDAAYVSMDYVGVSCVDGQQFDSSWDNGEPITVALGTAEETASAFSVIPGWTEGLAGVKAGALVQLDIPYEDAYGAAGRPPSIAPKAALTFVIRVISVSEEPPPDPTTTTVAGDPTATTAPADGGTTTTAPADGETTTTAAAEAGTTTTTAPADGGTTTTAAP